MLIAASLPCGLYFSVSRRCEYRVDTTDEKKDPEAHNLESIFPLLFFVYSCHSVLQHGMPLYGDVFGVESKDEVCMHVCVVWCVCVRRRAEEVSKVNPAIPVRPISRSEA